MEKIKDLHNGYSLYYKENEAGGRTYYSDECGCLMTTVWDTAITRNSTLFAALDVEQSFIDNEKLTLTV